ncbi:MAG: peptidylprolyl isomerase, partial [Bacteroidetes bacterium]|nr:peptidylprolyl isomerase [Bacteroidota bacterium]
DKLLKITTSKGEIVIKLKVNESPASVANFMKLVDSGYYNGKYFHRMVSDFVVQGGCPRGDGWGSLNWMQKSEFSNELRYQPGSVGLASSGKDSEGVQFFITHQIVQAFEF